MPKISADQLRAMAKCFSDLGAAIQDYRFAHADSLSTADFKRLQDSEEDLIQKSNDLNAKAIGLTLDDLRDALDSIARATTKLREGVKKLEAVDKIVQLGVAGVELAAVILTENPASISSAISDALKTLSAVMSPGKGKDDGSAET